MEGSWGRGMRRRYLIVLLVVLSLFNLSVFAADYDQSVSPFSLPVSVIVLDAGHGGHDPGAVATYHWDDPVEIQEKEIVLDITLRLADILEENHPEIRIVTTRSSDEFITLEQRSAIVSTLDPRRGRSAIFVSIHANSAAENGASGVEFLIKRTDKWVRFLSNDSPDWALARYANHTMGELNRLLNRENLYLASMIQQQLINQLGDVRNRGIKEQDIWVLNASKVPSVLIEIGFMSNEDEARKMMQDAWRQEIASAIAQAIDLYINRD